MNQLMVPPRAGGGLTIITAALADYEPAFAIARRCAELRKSLPVTVQNLHTAKMVRATLLPRVDEIYSSWRTLVDMTSAEPRRRIARPEAAEMLGYLFAVLRRNDKGADVASLLTACVEMLADDGALAAAIATKPLPRHPAVLALAIRKIIATAVFPPAPAEIATAMQEIFGRLRMLRSQVWGVFQVAIDAERLAFKEDRAGWALPYTSGKVPSVVACHLVDDSDAEWSGAVNDLIDN